MFRYEAAMAAVLGREKLDSGIPADSGGQEGSVRDEGIVLCGDHEHGDADVSRYALRAHMVVIVLGVAIAEMRRGDDVIELTDSPNGSEALHRVALRKHFVLSRVAGHQTLHKTALVHIVVPALEGVGGSSKVEGGTNRADCTQRFRHGRAKLSGHLGHQISAHGVAGEEDLLETVSVRELFENGPIIRAHTGIVKSGRQSFGAAAIPLVHAHDVEAAMESLLCDPADVIGIAGTLQAVDDDNDGRVLALPRLPVAMGEQMGFRIDLEQPGFGRRDIEPPPHKSRNDGHDVAVFQQ